MNNDTVKRINFRGSRVACRYPRNRISSRDPATRQTMQVDLSPARLGVCRIFEIKNKDLNVGPFSVDIVEMRKPHSTINEQSLSFASSPWGRV